MSDSFVIKKSQVFLLVGITVAVIVGMTIYNNIVQPAVNSGAEAVRQAPRTIRQASKHDEALKITKQVWGKQMSDSGWHIEDATREEYLEGRSTAMNAGLLPWAAEGGSEEYPFVFYFKFVDSNGTKQSITAVMQKRGEEGVWDWQ